MLSFNNFLPQICVTVTHSFPISLHCSTSKKKRFLKLSLGFNGFCPMLSSWPAVWLLLCAAQPPLQLPTAAGQSCLCLTSDFSSLNLLFSSSWGVDVCSTIYMILVCKTMQRCVVLVLPVEPERTSSLKSIFPPEYQGLSVQLLERFSKYGSVVEIGFEKRSSATSSQSNWCL